MYRVCTEIRIVRRHSVFGHSVLYLPRQAPGPSCEDVRVEMGWNLATPSGSLRWRKFEKDGGEDQIGQEGTEVLGTLNVGRLWPEVSIG